MPEEQETPPKEEHKHKKKETEEPLIDPSYVKRISSRSVFLQKKSLQVKESSKITKRRLTRSQVDLAMEIETLRNELDELNTSIYETVERVKSAVTRFQHIAKRGDLTRVQQRMDAWAPESRLSRDQFRQLLIDTGLVKQN